MKRFRFPLETVLRVRERKVEEQEVLLQAVRAELSAQQRKIEDLAAEVEQEHTGIDVATAESQDLIALAGYRSAAARKRLRLQKDVEEIGKRVLEREAAWRIAERDRELLVQLRDKARSRWQKEYEKEQDALAEEVYLSRWAAR